MRTAATVVMALCGALNLSSTWAEMPFTDIIEKTTEAATPKNIHVLLSQGVSEALLEVNGPYFLFNPHDGTKVSSGLLGKRFMIHPTEAGLRWGEEFPGIYQLYLQPRSEETSIFVNGIQYTGNVVIYAVHGHLNIVNDLDIESYVKGLLSAQASSPMEAEVLSALAILARTDAYHAVLKQKEAFWHVSSTEKDFPGAGLIAPNSAIERAVDSTRHLILVRPVEGQTMPFAATWTEHSAGKTAAYQTMFRKEVSGSNGVDAPHAAMDRKETKWSHTISKKSLANLLDVPQIKAIELFQDSISNKVYGLRVKDGDETFDFDFFNLQQRIGKKHLKSSDFTVSVKDESIIFTGFGQGHGVGLCLYSASAMAQNGDNAVKILSRFFPETYLMNLNALPR